MSSPWWRCAGEATAILTPRERSTRCRGRDDGCRRCYEMPASRTSPARSCGWSHSRSRSHGSKAPAAAPGDRRHSPNHHRPAPARSDSALPPPRRCCAPSDARAATPAPIAAAAAAAGRKSMARVMVQKSLIGIGHQDQWLHCTGMPAAWARESPTGC